MVGFSFYSSVKLLCFANLNVLDLLAVVETAIRADVMRTDFRSAIRAGNSIYSTKLSMLTDLTLLCMTSSSSWDCHSYSPPLKTANKRIGNYRHIFP